MFQRLSLTDRVAGICAALAAILVFAPWSSVQTAGTGITLNGFRAFPFGLLFYVGAIGTVLVVLQRAGYLQFDIPRNISSDRALRWTTGTMAASALIEFMRNIGSSVHAGFWLAFLLSLGAAAAIWNSNRKVRHYGEMI